jgi:hypothetical protein
MTSLDDALAQISELKGHLLAHDVFIEALLRALPADALGPLSESLSASARAMQAQMLPTPVPDRTVTGFERAVQTMNARMHALQDGALATVSVPARK